MPSRNSLEEKKHWFPEIFFLCLRFWKGFILSIVFCFAIAFIYLRYATREYIVYSTVLMDVGRQNSIYDLSVLQDLLSPSSRNELEDDIRVMTSRALMKEVVDSLQLGVAYYQVGHFKKREIYNYTPVFIHITDPTDWGSFMLDQINDSTFSITSKDKSFTQTFQINEEIDSPYGQLSFSKNPFGMYPYPIEIEIKSPYDLPIVSVSPLNEFSNVVYVYMNTPTPDKGIDIIQTLIGVYNRRNKEEKNLVANQTIRFIDDRLPAISRELKQAEKAVEKYKLSNELTNIKAEAQMLLLSKNDYAKRGMEVETQLSILTALQEYLTSPENEGKVAPANVGLTDPTIVNLIRRYNEEVLEKSRLTYRVAPSNPLIQEYEEQIAQLKENLLEGITIYESGLHFSLMEIYKQEIESSEKTQEFSTYERNWLHLFREKDLKEKLFTFLLLKKEETALSLELATPGAKEVDEVEYGLVYPSISWTLLIALAIGLVAPLCFLFIRSLFDNKLHDKKQLSKMIKAPFLGEISVCSSNPIFPVLNLHSQLAENFSLIHANLDFVVARNQSVIVMVTSSCSEEGKSFFSQNLAMSLATIGKKTLLMDTDMRKSNLNKVLEINSEKDFSLFLADSNVEYSQIIDKTASFHKNLDIIPIKVFPPNPSELLTSNRLETLFKTARKEYDYIIVDTAPIGVVPDAFSISPFTDASIFVTRAHYTPISSLKEIQNLDKSNRLHNLCLVLNAASVPSQYGSNQNNITSNKKRTSLSRKNF